MKKKTQHNYLKSYSEVEGLRIVYSGKDYFDTLLQLINSAKKRIDLQIYIFDDDTAGKLISDALIRAAERHVVIYILLDAFGSKNLPGAVIEQWKKAGIHFRLFAPFKPFKNLFIGRRLHHKVVVADSEVALVGGINVSDKYYGVNNEVPWLDYAILIRGALCESLSEICHQIFIRKFKKLKNTSCVTDPENKLLACIRQNDRFRRKKEIYRSYIHALRTAKKTVHISGSYFLPGRQFRRELMNAAKRGVEIKLILAGNSDIPSFQNATRWLYDFLWRHNIKVYEWNKSVLHGKAAVVDGQWCTIGSYNLNHLSGFGSIELNVDAINEKIASQLKDHFETIIINDCTEIIPGKIATNIFARLNRWLAYNFTRLSMKFLATFPKISLLGKDE